MDRTRRIQLADGLTRLRETPWSTVLGFAYFILIVALVLKFALPAALRGHLGRSFLVAPLLPLMAKDLAHLPELFQRVRAATASRAGCRALACAFFPPTFFALLRLDREMRCGFVAWLCRRPLPARPPGQAFTFLERGSYPTAVALVLVSAFGELPVLGIGLSHFVHDPARRLLLHLILGGTCAYGLVWILADRRAVRASAHVLDGACLDLQVGVRTRCRLPVEAIARCERVDESRERWCAQRGVKPSHTLVVTPIDRPNCVLVLAPGADVCASHWGGERGGFACIFLYVDRPEALAAALSGPTPRPG
jgi:hypothetical protein